MTGRFRRRRGLSYVVDGDALVLGGSVPAARLRGGAATTAVPALLGALDGHAGRRELAAAAGVAERHVDGMLSMLGRHGAVESATVAAEPDSAAAGFFAAMAGHQADPRSGEELLASLAGTAVEVLGEDVFAAKLRAAAATSGPRADRMVVGAEASALTERWRGGCAVLPVWAAGGELVIGPFTRIGLNPCPGCVIGGRPAVVAERHHDLAVALVAALIPVLVTAAVPAQARHVDFASGRTRFVPTSSRPGCQDCLTLGEENA